MVRNNNWCATEFFIVAEERRKENQDYLCCHVPENFSMMLLRTLEKFTIENKY